MKGAIGNAMVMNIVIIFIVLTTAFLVGSIAYSKAYKIKSHIVDIIEKYNGNFDLGDNASTIIKEIDDFLGQSGYRTSSLSSRISCDNYKNTPGDQIKSGTSSYDICIIKAGTNSKGYSGDYYKVVVYMYFDFPVISDAIKIPVTGETKSFFKPVE